MKEQSEYITGTATATLASQLGGTVLIDPAALGDGPCEIHRLDEDHWREILTKHRPGDAAYFGRTVCACGWEERTGSDSAVGWAAFIEHILHVAAITPEPYRGPLQQIVQLEPERPADIPDEARTVLTIGDSDA